jgi:hypothetical protein
MRVTRSSVAQSIRPRGSACLASKWPCLFIAGLEIDVMMGGSARGRIVPAGVFEISDLINPAHPVDDGPIVTRIAVHEGCTRQDVLLLGLWVDKPQPPRLADDNNTVAIVSLGELGSQRSQVIVGKTNRKLSVFRRAVDVARCGGLRRDRRFWREAQQVQEKRIWASLPSSLRIAGKGVLKPRHFLGVRLAVMTMSWISSSDRRSMSM